jgi:tRNA(Ile)-lysidine synthase
MLLGRVQNGQAAFYFLCSIPSFRPSILFVRQWIGEIEEMIVSKRLFRNGQSILVAVSGGLDSMVLLNVLDELAMTHRWKLTVAHFNHRLRGRQSDADERFVARAARKMGLPFATGSADVKRFARKEDLSIEMAARQLRHAFLARTAKRRRIPSIALAHHGDDQVELFLLRLLRGAGGEGLAGMKWKTPSPADRSVTVARPFLAQARVDLERFAAERKIAFREDPTNAQIDFLRNRVRHELVPLLKAAYQPALFRTTLRVMEIIGADSEFATQTARGWLKRRKPPFDRLPAAMQRRVLQLQLQHAGVGSGFELIEELRAKPGKAISVGATQTVIREPAGTVRLRRTARMAFNPDSRRMRISRARGKVFFDGVNISWHMMPFKRSGLIHEANCEQFDANKVGAEITLRHWRPGDRFQPIGASSPRKLQDLFVNQKIPAARRRQLLVAQAESGVIFWVEGLRIGELFKLEKATKWALNWRWRRG